MLALEHASEHFLVRTALEDAALDAEPGEDPAALVGRQLGDYRVDAVVGAGGMADVYRVRNVPLARDEALKVLVPSPLVREGDRIQVEAEARAASRLNHPNIVTIYAVGEADGRHFIAMELVEGDLRQRLAAGPLPVPEVTDLAVQLADALAAALRPASYRDLTREPGPPEGRLGARLRHRGREPPTPGRRWRAPPAIGPEQARASRRARRRTSSRSAWSCTDADWPARSAVAGRDAGGGAAERGDCRPRSGRHCAAAPMPCQGARRPFLDRGARGRCRAWQARARARRPAVACCRAGAAVARRVGAGVALRWSSRRCGGGAPLRSVDQAGVGYLADGLTAR